MKLKVKEIIEFGRCGCLVTLSYKKSEQQHVTKMWINPKTVQNLIVDYNNDTFTIAISDNQNIEIDGIKNSSGLEQKLIRGFVVD